MLNILAAKRAGYTDETIARAIAEIYNKDYDQLEYSPETLIQAAMEIEGQDMSTWDSFIAGAEAEVGSEITGIEQIITGQIDAEDVAKENLAQISSETNPIATGLGRFIGGLVNPSTLAPGSAVFKGVKGLVAGGAIGGGIAGGLRPIFVEEEELGRVGSTAVGVGAGAALGGLLGKLFGPRAIKTADDLTETPAKVIDTASVEAGEKIDIPKADIEPPFAEEDLNRFMDINRSIQMGENVTPADLRFITDFNKTVEGLELTPEAKRAFDIQDKLAKGENITPAESFVYRQFVNDKETPIFDLTKIKGKGEPTQPKAPEDIAAEADIKAKQAKDAAATEAPGGKAFSKNTLEYAEATGDYRDYLTTSVTRLAQIPSSSFAKMTAEKNPYKEQNFKVLLTRVGADDPDLKQFYSGIQGRLKYEKQTGKTIAEITAQAKDNVPESVAIEALLNRKVEEILPPEIYASAIEATGKALDDLMNAKGLAQYARDTGDDKAYALLHAEMSRTAGLIASLEGNASNLGRALAYQKTFKDLVDVGGKLPSFLGGVQC